MPLMHTLEKKRLTPLSLVTSRQASDERRKGNLLLADSAGKVRKFPLVKPKRGILQGVFEIQRRGKPAQRLYFYLNELPGDAVKSSHLFVYNNSGKRIAEFSRALGHRKTSPSYRELGIATTAFDLIESELSDSGTKDVITPTRKITTASFLSRRGYRAYDDESLRILADYVYNGAANRNAFDNTPLPDEVQLYKPLPVVGKGRTSQDMSRYHRIAIKGRDGKIKYWYGHILRPNLK